MPQSPQHSPGDRSKKEHNAETLIDYLKHHVRETFAYVLMVLGIILILFDNFIGGILVGIVGGIYFADEIIAYILRWKAEMSTHAFSKNLVVAGLVLAFLIVAPSIFLGAAIAIGIKQLFLLQQGDSKK